MNRKLLDFKQILGHDKLLVGEFFKGYGSQSMSLDAIGVPNEVVVSSEIDADAIISYASIRHPKEELNKIINLKDDEIKQWLMDRNIGYDFKKNKSSIPRMKKSKLVKLYNSCKLDNEVGDISLINPAKLPDFDLMTYSFPCTDISVAGNMEGLSKGSGTRSGLLWECEKIIREKKPKYLLMENVKNLVSKKFKPDFDKWFECLEKIGYKNYWQVLNAKDYGIPQNRERVFMISILGVHEEYVFPEKQELKIRLKDILEEEVEEKYYIDNDASKKLIDMLIDKNKQEYEQTVLWGGMQNNQSIKTDGVSTCLTSAMGMGGGYVPMVSQKPCDCTLNDPNFIEIANCITSRYDSGIQNYKQIGVAVLEKDISPNRIGNIYGENFGTRYDIKDSTVCEQRIDEGLRFFKDNVCGTLRTIDSCGDKRVLETGSYELELYDNLSGGKWDKIHELSRRVYSDIESSPTVSTCGGGNVEPKVFRSNEYRIRKLTPKECWRLMGVKDELFEKVSESGISNSQLYKQAGNSIVRNCLDEIFKNLFFEKSIEKYSEEINVES